MRRIITGYFGSGKTEIAMQMARDQAAKGNKVTLIDLDVVNPYFTSSAHKNTLVSSGVHIVSPGFANSNVDAPQLTGGIHAALVDRESDVIVDLGGDATGATVMGSLVPLIRPGFEFIFLLAVNTFRPFTQTKEQIKALMEDLEAHARLRVAGFVNNANMLDETEPEHLLQGDRILREAAEMTGRPILFHCGTEELIEANHGKLSGQPVVLHPHNSPSWLRHGSIRT